MKSYHQVVTELRKQYKDGDSPSIDAVFHVWDERAPGDNASREDLIVFWGEVAEWAQRLANAAAVCGNGDS